MSAKDEARAAFEKALDDAYWEYPEDKYAVDKTGYAYAAAAVAEARAPLVEALEAALHALTTYQGLWANDKGRDGGAYSFQLSDTALLDQITDILGPPSGQPEARDATEMHGV